MIISSPVIGLAAVFLAGGCLAAFSLSGCQTAPETLPAPEPVEPEGAPPSQAQPECTDSGSPAPADANSDEIKLVVTRDFGSKVIIEENVIIGKNTDAMEALMSVAQVETAYGGGFVNAINGLASGYTEGHEKEDWFIYFNGMSSNVGALDYILAPGDVEHWDYRDWGFHQFVPAIVGDFPEPFRHGHGGVVFPTLVVYQEGWEGAATEIENELIERGVSGVSIKGAGELGQSEKESSNIILVGNAGFPLIEEVNGPWNRLGFYCHFEEGSLRVFDGGGDLTAEYGAGDGAGLIQATQSIWNPDGVGACESVIWMVTGTDDDGVEAAVGTLVDPPDAFEYAYAAVTVDGEMVRVP